MVAKACNLLTMPRDLTSAHETVQKGGGGPAGLQYQMLARASGSAEHHAPRPSCARHCHKNANKNTPGITNHTRGAREGAQRGSWGPGTLCLSAPFAEPRPPAESPRNALSNQHCLMLQRRAFTSNCPLQKRQNYAYKMLPQNASGTRPEQATQYITHATDLPHISASSGRTTSKRCKPPSYLTPAHAAQLRQRTLSSYLGCPGSACLYPVTLSSCAYVRAGATAVRAGAADAGVQV